MINQQITLEQAIAVIRGSLSDSGLLAAVVGQPTPAPVREEQEAPAGVDPSIRAVADRLVAVQLRTGAANADTCAALQKCADLIAEATGVTDIREMRQHHVVALCAMLDRLPPSYRKSASEREMTLEQIAAKAEAEGRSDGLAVGTVNRILTNFSMLVKRADDEGLQIHPKLKPTSLRRKRTKKSRADRLAFTQDHIKSIFQSPVWQGCQNVARRHRPGPNIIKDGLFWLPLVAAYTGARREEIAGLDTKDLREVDGIWCLDIRENEHRGVKTDASTRLIPVHPHLLELGILDLRKNDGLLFDDMYRKTAGGPLGECIAYNWRRVLEERLPSSDLPKRCFHSFRHSVIDLLEGMDDVRDRTIKAIIGHTPDSITSKVYGSEATPAAMLKAIERLPRVF
ncbi:site-specific integrase [Paracoccus angustae]|uniref:Site-specific integrase n=1 Tax=Paracoccus angustae TaxID=1671480 RepID=A0ABV7UBM5_9RHOB